MGTILVADVDEVVVDDVMDDLVPDTGVVMKAPPKFIQSPRIRKLAQRSRELAISGKRRLGTEDSR